MTEALHWQVEQIAEWVPFSKAAGFFLATFVLEDVAAIGAGLLLATGSISWPAAFLACFLGIWSGDAGLYTLARFGGRRWFEQSRFKRFSCKVAQSEQWFARRGASILVFSRMIPGARLPTYLAAGFLRVPWNRFLFITGAASLAWTFLVLLLARALGLRLVHWLGAYKLGGLVLVGVGLACFLGVQAIRRLSSNLRFQRVLAQLGRWRRWEFWPAWLFYPPVAVWCLWLALKYRGLTLPTVANPGMFSGGIVGESKSAILEQLFSTSPEFTANAALIAGGTYQARLECLEKVRLRLGLDYPFILKPDVGQRGLGVKFIRTPHQAEAYLVKTPAPLVAQPYAEGPFEAGIFYYRFPHEDRGHIFAITEKSFPFVTGDGQSNLSELIHQDSRARFMSAKYLERFGGRENEVLPRGQSLKLVEAGNHAQGCIFRDGSHLLTPELESCIDEISQKLCGFFIGRYDIRYSDESSLKSGRNFQIIELNGAGSEATSIYDARNSLFSAYRTLFRQWELVFAIGAANRQRGETGTSPSLVWQKWREFSRLARTYPVAD
jgi:membrane protein DedA with SNARE-associated domain